WTDLNGQPVLDPKLAATLARPYDPNGTDSNLNTERRWALEALVGSEWPSRCNAARTLSESSLRGSDIFTEAVVRATSDFDAARRKDHLQRQSRHRHLAIVQERSDADEMLLLEAFDDVVARALAEPTVRLDSVGCVVLSRLLPEGPGF